MVFEFATANRILFGPGALAQVGVRAAEIGRRAWVVSGSSRQRAVPLLVILEEHGLATSVFTMEGEPTVERVREGTRQAAGWGADLVIAIGGGSALDAGKALAILLTNRADPLEYLEVIGAGKPLTLPGLPCIAIPTTAGAGTEVTRNAVLTSPEHRVKASLRSPYILPRLAIVDPELSASMPPAVTASTGLDALTQLIEPFVSKARSPLVDPFCREGMRRIARSLRHAFEDGGNMPARQDMALASLFGGIALANAGLGAVHGFASPLGGMYPAPHGAVCARLLPHVMRTNLGALRARQPGSDLSRRYDEIAELLTGIPGASAEEGIAWVDELCGALQVPPLRTYGVAEADLPDIIEQARSASSMRGNPIALDQEELLSILRRAL